MAKQDQPSRLFAKCGYTLQATLTGKTMIVWLPCDLPKGHTGDHNTERMTFTEK